MNNPKKPHENRLLFLRICHAKKKNWCLLSVSKIFTMLLSLLKEGKKWLLDEFFDAGRSLLVDGVTLNAFLRKTMRFYFPRKQMWVQKRLAGCLSSMTRWRWLQVKTASRNGTTSRFIRSVILERSWFLQLGMTCLSKTWVTGHSTPAEEEKEVTFVSSHLCHGYGDGSPQCTSRLKPGYQQLFWACVI